MSIRPILMFCAVVAVAGFSGCRTNSALPPLIRPEQTSIAWRPPEAVTPTPIPSFNEPRTVSRPDNGLEPLRLSLDEAIRIALSHSEVVRVLTGFSASSSGSTIYDPGIANTAIDQAQGRFDPQLSIDNSFLHNESGQGGLIVGPPGAEIFGSDSDTYQLNGQLSKTNIWGGRSALSMGVIHSELEPGTFPLNPQTSHFLEPSYVQPLLQGAGRAANEAPILIARIETERSFFQFKDSVQQLVRGVVEGYWSLVFARTDRWARQQQVTLTEFEYNRQLARKERGLGNKGDVSQSLAALANFRSSLVAAKSNVLQREAALLNILGLSPTEVGELIPLTPPHETRVGFDWQELIGLAETYRPDLIELKLIIEADQQRAIIAHNNAQPQLDLATTYRWDGLQGRTPSGPRITTTGGELTDWTLGVNFSVPLGLRQARADVRRQELLILRDQANLEQGLHSAVHQLALSVRTLDQSYEQYLAFLQTRAATEDNLQVQLAEFNNGRTIFLNVLQALVDWRNAVSSEAQTLADYNTELANLELQTGTILETHGIRFSEEQYQFAGPLYCLDKGKCYAGAIRPLENGPKYESGEVPSEEAFDLEPPIQLGQPKTEQKKPPTLEDFGFNPATLPGAGFDNSSSAGEHIDITGYLPIEPSPTPQSVSTVQPPFQAQSYQSRSTDSVIKAAYESQKNSSAADIQSSVDSKRSDSLVPERFDWVEATGLSGWVKAEEDPHGGSKENRNRSGRE